jgi:serine/threonine protein kinase
MKYQLHPPYLHLHSLIDHIEEHFQRASEVLHAERNEIRVVEFEGEEYVVKSFKIPNLINRFAYRYLRASKAKRSYDYSLLLGVEFCPEPVAYIEHFQYGLLARSYYISHYFRYDFTIRPILNTIEFDNRRIILQKFAEFTYQLHQRGILHHDYSPGNILIKKQQNNYVFKVIDVNRMQFRHLNLDDRLSNFSRLSIDNDTMKTIVYRYAQLLENTQDEVFNKAINSRNQFLRQRKLKNTLRGR